MWPRFGIKIGNSTLCIAHVQSNGKVEVIANKQGDRTSQACLLWDGKTNEIECGLTAKQKMSLRPKQAVANSFQLLQGRKVLLQHIPCEYNAETNKFKLRYEEIGDTDGADCPERVLTPPDVQVHLLKAELELARQYFNDKLNKPIVVLSIPSYYDAVTRKLLADIGHKAGFHVAQIIAEPTAALMAYNLSENIGHGRKYILTIKSGGLFSHFGVYELNNELFMLHDAYGPFSIGGDDYTNALVNFICSEFKRKYKLDPQESRRSMAKIRNAAANCKHVLTSMPSTQIYIDSLMDGLDFNMQMSRARFDSLIQPVINNFMQTMQGCIKEVSANIASIVLLGATMQIPKLKASIATQFPDAKIHATIPSDEVVAVGCARQATYLAKPEEQLLSLQENFNFAADQIVIWHGEDDSKAQVLLQKGAILPHRVLVKVPFCSNTEEKEIFHMRAGNTTEQVQLHGIKPNNEKCCCIEAEITFAREDDKMPLIRLRAA